MKKTHVLLALLFCFLLTQQSCTDDDEAIAPKPQLLSEEIQSARQFFEEHVKSIKENSISAGRGVRNSKLRGKLKKNALWDQAFVKDISIGKAVIVPLDFQEECFAKLMDLEERIPIEFLSHAMIYKGVDKKMHVELVTAIPDKRWINDVEKSIFSGVIIIEDWEGNFIKGYKYFEGQIMNLSTTTRTNANMQCETIDWYTCTSTDGGATYSCNYDYSETTCVDDGENDPPYGGGSGGSGGAGGGTSGSDYGTASGGTSNLIFNAPQETKKVYNRADYLVCFDRTQPATMTVHVDPPSANSSTPASFSERAGHAWITITQFVNGVLITRSFGFYPDGEAKVGDEVKPSVMGNDASHDFDVSVSFPISSEDLNNVLNYSVNGIPSVYNLNSYNCTNFVIESCKKANVILPQNTTQWPGGGGLTPARLGQDLRTFDIQNKTESKNANGGFAPPNSGNCGNPIPES